MADVLIDARGVVVAYAGQRTLSGRRLPPRPVLHGVDLTIGRGGRRRPDRVRWPA